MQKNVTHYFLQSIRDIYMKLKQNTIEHFTKSFMIRLSLIQAFIHSITESVINK